MSTEWAGAAARAAGGGSTGVSTTTSGDGRKHGSPCDDGASDGSVSERVQAVLYGPTAGGE